MIVGKLRKRGDEFVITVPREEIERLALTEGQSVALEVRPVEGGAGLSPDLEAIADELIDQHAAALRFEQWLRAHVEPGSS